MKCQSIFRDFVFPNLNFAEFQCSFSGFSTFIFFFYLSLVVFILPLMMFSGKPMVVGFDFIDFGINGLFRDSAISWAGCQ